MIGSKSTVYSPQWSDPIETQGRVRRVISVARRLPTRVINWMYGAQPGDFILGGLGGPGSYYPPMSISQIEGVIALGTTLNIIFSLRNQPQANVEQCLGRPIPQFSARDLIQLIRRYLELRQPKGGNDSTLVAAGFIFPEEVQATLSLGESLKDQRIALCLKLGRLLREPVIEQDLLTFIEKAQSLPDEHRLLIIDQILEHVSGTAYPSAEPLLCSLMGILKKDLSPKLLIDQLQQVKLDNPDLVLRLRSDPGLRAMAPEILNLFPVQESKPMLAVAQYFDNWDTIDDYCRMAEQETPQETFEQVLAKLRYGRDLKARSLAFAALVQRNFTNVEVSNAAAVLLNEPDLPVSVRQLIEDYNAQFIQSRLSYLLGGQPATAAPTIIKEWAQTTAGEAVRAASYVNRISKFTQRPLITIYILSTGLALKAERLFDVLYSETTQRVALYTAVLSATRNRSCLLAKQQEETLAQFAPDSPKYIAEQIAFITRRFYALTYKNGGQTGFLETILKTAKQGLDHRILGGFSFPLLLKIPSNINRPISDGVSEQLKQVVGIAYRLGCDIALIDDSTVRREGELEWYGYPEGSGRGRAIARGVSLLKYFCEQSGVVPEVNWLYKDNNWQWELPMIQCGPVPLRIFGINTYTGKERIGSPFMDDHERKWMPGDDHQRTIYGFGSDDAQKATSHSAVVLENGQPVFAHALFWREFHTAVRLLNQRPLTPHFVFKNIVFVCQANHHRSQSADWLFQRILEERYGSEALQQVKISSAGLGADEYYTNWPQNGQIDYRVVDMLWARGIDARAAKKTQLTEEIIDKADLIVVMTQRQHNALLQAFPDTEARWKVQLMKEFAGMPGERDFPNQPRHCFDDAYREGLEIILGLLADKIVA